MDHSFLENVNHDLRNVLKCLQDVVGSKGHAGYLSVRDIREALAPAISKLYHVTDHIVSEKDDHHNDGRIHSLHDSFSHKHSASDTDWHTTLDVHLPHSPKTGHSTEFNRLSSSLTARDFRFKLHDIKLLDDDDEDEEGFSYHAGI